MLKNNKLNRIAIAVAMSVGLSSAAMAQETSSSLTGTISGPQGNPAVGTKVIITHVPSGSTKTTTVNGIGQFSAKGLRVGGPYSITFDSDQFADKTVDDIFLQLGEVPSLNLTLTNDDVERISVVGSAMGAVEFGTTSPGSTFDITDLQQAATADRDIKDLVRIDPRISIAEANGDEAIICGGNNPRFSSLTVDGVRMNDSFGLNFNGYPTIRMPFSFDAIDQVAVEIAPFDVQYGGFTGCNINAVTKSGTNEVHGGVFFDYTSDALQGDEIAGEKVDLGDFDVKRYGFNVGAPLIKDKLFLFAAYEKLEGAQIFTYEALNNGAVSMEEVNRAIQIAKDVYGYDAGGLPTSAPVEDEKLLLKLDWNINDSHRAALVYNYNDGFLIDQSDESSSRVTLSNHFYKKGATLDAVVASLYSDWSDDFSTEIRIGHTKLDNLQQSVDQDSGFGEVQISSLEGFGAIFLGPDDSRQSNELDWDSTTLKVAGTYYLDDHTITGGYEYESLSVFNLFMQHTIGEYRFGGDRTRNSSDGTSGLDDFESGIVDDIYYNNSAVTNNPDDAAASFSYATHALYVQDEWSIDDLTLQFGLRYDWISSSDKPNFNQDFQDRYGYSNQNTFDGEGVLQPRVGFNYAVNDSFELRGGLGLYQGGNPNVWLSNSYSNDGITNIDTLRTDTQILAADGTPIPGLISGDGRAIFNPLVEQVQEVADNDPSFGAEPSTNAIADDFKLPTEWKYNLGVTYATEDDYIFQADFLYTKKQDSATVIDASIEQDGTLVDGRPVYEKLTVTDTDGNSTRRHFLKNDFILTNAPEDGDSTTVSFAMNKEYDYGLDVFVGYAYNKSTEYNPMTSAVSFSNYSNISVSDPLNPGIETSNYEVPHNFTFNLRYSAELINGHDTTFSLFGSRKKGRPYSVTYENLRINQDTNAYRQLVYIPTMEEYGTAVKFASAEAQADFDQFVSDFGLEGSRGSILARNSIESDWSTRVDFRIDQEVPGFVEGHSGNVFLVIKNLGNLLNDDWGVTNQGPFNSAAVIDADIEDDGTYTYNEVDTSAASQSPFQTQSLWQVRVGVRYRF
ncbi:TonB-dependent receptor [Paraglaciecola aquimarina]|uniref:TonB-dependent receptor n=1 Tax=Paraglaciecola aquimarina TaxID=1235557 RepID=A0ABU3SSB3_9ALTE|nr:TonB-dependent receptor [Paraglaciecola aquimarina]MDU0352875.1 TonB-dependent receptor [Paraglaciecola aquimarina]